EALEITGPDGRTHAFVNEANTIFEDCAPRIETDGCAFVREMRAFLAASEGPRGGGVDAARGAPLCGLVDTYAPTRPVRPVRGDGLDCDPVFAVGDRIVRLRLRSLDDMVYYVGELMRAGAMRAGPGEAIEAEVTVRAAGLRGGGRGVPLFRIVPASADDARTYTA